MLTDAQLDALARHGEERTAAVGDVLFRIGDRRYPFIAIREGEWSGWLRVKFKLGMLQSVRGMVRFHLSQLEPTLAFYALLIVVEALATASAPTMKPADA